MYQLHKRAALKITSRTQITFRSFQLFFICFLQFFSFLSLRATNLLTKGFHRNSVFVSYEVNTLIARFYPVLLPFQKMTSEFVNTKTMPVIPKQVKDIAEQDEFESRRLWKEVTYCLKVSAKTLSLFVYGCY